MNFTKAKQMIPVIALAILSTFGGCKSSSHIKGDEAVVLIETDMGDITLKLYNETPKHRDNFIKLAEEGFYDGVVFHRVIENFMIQGGDPSTKESSKSTSDDAGYTIDAEFVPQLIHKKGALAAARMGDAQNPEKKSSGSQFYIVQGQVFNLDELEKQAERKNQMIRNSKINEMVMNKADRLMDEGINPDFTKIYTEMQDTIALVINNLEPYKFSKEQIDAYTTIGGTPHLDGDYTVFGEVIDGFDVIDKIAAVETGPADKPIKDVRMRVKVLKK
ncbi:MAG: peptidylprolyl isomerase [Tenuifilaceae bacterium]|nr:peptidylprolyl isomerase [Tenuifilaceae bacterium]